MALTTNHIFLESKH